MSKKYILVFVIVVLALILGVVLRDFKKIDNSLPNFGNIRCVYPITISGQAMEPAIKAGTRLMLSKCFRDKQNMAVGTVVVFTENGVNKVGRIKGKVVEGQETIYKVERDARPDELFTISPDQILASDEKYEK